MTSAEYNRCVDELADGVYRFVLKNIKDPESAKDIVQDTFEKMWRLREGIDASKAKAYLFTAAYRTLIDYTRRNRYSVSQERIPEPFSDKDFENHDVRHWIDIALSQLPEDQRAVITLRDLEGYSYQEIEEITGLSEAQVKVYIYRGRAAMKKFLVSREVLV